MYCTVFTVVLANKVGDFKLYRRFSRLLCQKFNFRVVLDQNNATRFKLAIKMFNLIIVFDQNKQKLENIFVKVDNIIVWRYDSG